jgi:hypothetical protein
MLHLGNLYALARTEIKTIPCNLIPIVFVVLTRSEQYFMNKYKFTKHYYLIMKEHMNIGIYYLQLIT